MNGTIQRRYMRYTIMVRGNLKHMQRQDIVHHTLKVLPADSIKVVVKSREGRTLKIREKMKWFQARDTDRLYHTNGTHTEQYRWDREGNFYCTRCAAVPQTAEAVPIEPLQPGRYRIVGRCGTQC